MQDYSLDHIWRRLFVILITLYAGIILLTFLSYGITTDEPLHVAYGQHIARWYTSFFHDQTVFTASNLWLYGGLFDTLIQILHQVLPIDIYDLRHLICAFVGLCGVIGIYKIATYLSGPKAGLLAAFFLILTPHYYGHAFNNTKDIPFAVTYLWGLYYIVQCLGALPHLSRGLIVKTGVAIGCALAIRAGAALLIAYLGLFFCLRYLQLYLKGEPQFLKTWPSQFLNLFFIGGIAYITLFPFYPWMHLHPLTGLWDSLTAFSNFPEVHYNFFQGHYIPSNDLPWYYVSTWLLITLPEFAVPTLVAGSICLFFNRSQHGSSKRLEKIVIGFAAFFPIVYGAVTHTPLLNGIRHMTFVLPPLMVLCALSTLTTLQRLSQVRLKQMVTATVFGAAILTLSDMIALHPNQYLYFNRLFAGGLPTASKNYEIDYWNNTYKQGLDWVEKYIQPPPNRQLVVGSLYKNVPLMIRDHPIKFTQTPEDADIYLGNVWFDHHRAVAGEVLHVIQSMGTPLLYIIRPDSSYQSDPFFTQSPLFYNQLGNYYRSKGDRIAALSAYEHALPKFAQGFKATWLDSTGIMNTMGNILLQLDQPEAALDMFRQMPHHDVYEAANANSFGAYYIEKQAYEQALPWLEKAVALAPNYFQATTNLGTLYLDLNDPEKAADMFQKTAERHAQNAEHQFLMGKQLLSLKRYDEASICFRRMIDLRYDDIRGHYYLGLTLTACHDYVGARKALEQTLAFDPTYGYANDVLNSIRDK